MSPLPSPRILRRLRPRGAAPFLFTGFLLLTLVVALAMLFGARERANSMALRGALVREARLVDVLSSARQAESGLRGYLLTGNSISLHTYEAALAALPRQLAGLDSAYSGQDVPNLAPIHRLAGEKLAQLNAALALYQSGDTKAATAKVNTDLNGGTMQALRDLIGVLYGEESSHITADEEAAARDSLVLQTATTLTILFIILMAWFAIKENRAQTTKRRLAEAALLRANEILEHQVEARTATLAASEAQFRTLAEAMPGFVYITDAQGQNIYVNPQAGAYTGLAEAEVMNFGWTRTVYPDDLPTCLSLWTDCLAAGTPYENEFRIRRHDGVYRWFMARAVPVRDADQIITIWIGVVTDIDERKQAEATNANANALLESRVAERSLQLDRIFKLSTDILAVADFSGRFVSLSPAWEQITGRPVATALASNYFDFLHPEHVEKARASFVQMQEGTPIYCENRYQRADGTWCWLAWRAVPMPEEQMIYAVARDITAAREREDQLRQSQKMEVVGQLTGGVAHDFNNLLTIIMGSLEMLQRGLSGAEPKLLRRVEAAMEGANRAAALTQRLLAFSRRQPLAAAAIDINALLAGMSDMLHRTLGEHIQIAFLVPPGLCTALADTNQLENAILNLAVNARDAMPEGGRLVIEAQNTYLDEDFISGRADLVPGEYVMLAITDTGTGMDASVQAKVFEPFFTTKPQGEGTGLGLAQVYGFIKQSGGHISIESEPGQGTSVKLFLPRHHGAATAEPAAAHMPPPATGRGDRILLVEDEDGVRHFAAEVMEDLGYQVFAARNAAEAVEIFDREPGIKLLFTDVVLSGAMNGRQLAAQITAQRPDILVLFTTGYTSTPHRLDEDFHLITKPFTATALAQKLASLLVPVEAS
jgi:PAS domain S-box-containing protein